MFIEKRTRLSDPVVTAGDRVYCICSQNGLFPDPWGGHVPREMWGLWNHPIKLLDGFWFGVHPEETSFPHWLTEADAVRVHPSHTEFTYRLQALEIVRRDFVPDGVEGMVITLTLRATTQPRPSLRLTALFRSDLRPAWLGEQAGMRDAPDTANVEAGSGYAVFRDQSNAWTAVVGANVPLMDAASGPDLWAVQPTSGQGTAARLVYAVEFNEQGVACINFFIAGSAASVEQAHATFQRLQSEHHTLFAQKQVTYQRIVDICRLESPDPQVDAAFVWAKVNCQMLAREVDGIGRGAGAGLPEYPWWFGIDTEYAALPMLQAGLFDLTKETLALLKRVSLEHNRDEPGRVIHELATTGVVFNPGNLVETPAFVRAVHQCWLWTGDRNFLRAMYPFCKQGVLEYTLGTCDPDGDLCPSGRSIIETLEMHAGFECVDPAAYTWEALTRLADMAAAMGDFDSIPDFQSKADALAQRLRTEWWLEDEGLFADVRAPITKVREVLNRLATETAEFAKDHPARQQAEQARRLFEPLLVKYTGHPDDVDLPWLLRHWVGLCPVEVGVATTEQARRVLQRMESPEFSGAWGMYLHPERHAVMSINTGILAMAENEYGRVDQALRLVRRGAEALPYHMPGAISEALPDQWCFIQLWSACLAVAPVVHGFLGVSPRAGERHLRVVTHLPSAWDHARLCQLRVGEAFFDISTERTPDHYTVQVVGSDSGYSLEIGSYIPEGRNVREVILNGAPVDWQWQQTNAGRCVVCRTHSPAHLTIHLDSLHAA